MRICKSSNLYIQFAPPDKCDFLKAKSLFADLPAIEVDILTPQIKELKQYFFALHEIKKGFNINIETLTYFKHCMILPTVFQY